MSVRRRMVVSAPHHFSRDEVLVYVVLSIPAVVIAIVVVVSLATGWATGSPQSYPLPQPAPVGP